MTVDRGDEPTEADQWGDDVAAMAAECEAQQERNAELEDELRGVRVVLHEAQREIDRLRALVDEPTEADPGNAWADRVRFTLTEVLDADEVAEWAAMDDPGIQRWHLLAASHEKLRALVGGRSAAPTSEQASITEALAKGRPVGIWPETEGEFANRLFCAVCSRIAKAGADRRDESWHLADCAWVRARALLRRSTAEPPNEDGPARAARMLADVQAEHAATWPSCATAHGVAAEPKEHGDGD